MATLPSIKTIVNAQIRTETAAGGITPTEVADIIDSVINEVRDRGILWVANAAAVAAADPADSKHVGDISTGIVYRHNGSSYVAILTPGSGGGGTTLSTPTLTATVISGTEIDLSWTNVSNESSYRLEWSPNGSTGWTQIGGTIAANTTTYNHTGLTPSTAYYYRVKAVGDGVTYLDSGYGTDNGTTDAAGALPHTDTFTDTNGVLLTAHTPEAGNGYTNVWGTMDIQSNRASILTTATEGTLAVTEIGQQDCTITVIGARAASAARKIYIAWRYEDNQNFMFVLIYDNVVDLYKGVANTFTLINSYTPSPSINDTSDHTYVVTTGATNCALTVDGNAVFSGVANDAALTGTKVGFGASGVGLAATDVTFDSFNVTT